MALPLHYPTGEEIRVGDHIFLHRNPGRIEIVFDGENNSKEWAPIAERGITIRETESARLALCCRKGHWRLRGFGVRLTSDRAGGQLAVIDDDKESFDK
jgi:hypothetical protein